MRKLTDNDLANAVGTDVHGYRVERARVKRGSFSDSDCYGIALAVNRFGDCVTWQFHLLEDETLSFYWGHYFTEDREAALRDCENRDLDAE
jgi:hypothetical protein